MRRQSLLATSLFCCLAGCNVSSETTITELKSMNKDQPKSESIDEVEEALPDAPASMPAAPAAASSGQATPNEESNEVPTPITAEPPNAVATFGAGCFWCVEAVFLQLEGVVAVESGYMGGSVENPTYEQVCSGFTGHAEVCRIEYEPAKVRFDELLEVFWKVHDPTTLNRQGGDVGTQYRSAVFYHTPKQQELAEKYKKELDASGAWRDPIVTEITPAVKYYKAEDYHQNYFARNPGNGYCRALIPPKLEKLRAVFKDKLKNSDDATGDQPE